MVSKKFLFFSLLLLITFLQNATACSSHRKPRFNRYHFSNDDGRNRRWRGKQTDVQDNEFRCTLGLCEESTNYPQTEINEAVNRLRQSENEDSMALNFIDSYSHSKSSASKDVNSEALDNFGCKIKSMDFYPRVGFIGEESYYIVNVKNLQQRVRAVICKSDGVCMKSSKSCHQGYRVEKLLVFDSDKKISDSKKFSIKEFEIPDGCECTTQFFK